MATLITDIPPESESSGSAWPIVIGVVAVVALLLITIGVVRRRRTSRSPSPNTDD